MRGFYLYKSSVDTIELLTKMRQVMDNEKRNNKFSNDQKVLNEVLVNEGLQYDVNRLKYPYGRDATKTTILRVALFPHISFQRGCVNETDVEYSVFNATIAHCRGLKNFKNKRRKNTRMKIWELNIFVIFKKNIDRDSM